MKKLFLAGLFLLQAGTLCAQTGAHWLNQIFFMGEENIMTLDYVPGSGVVNPAVWTFVEGAENSGPGGTVFYEHHLFAYNTTDGSPLFDRLVEGATIYKVCYDAGLDQVLVLINATGGGTQPTTIGPDVFPGSTPTGCYRFGLLRYSRSGVLQGTQWLQFPCSHDLAGGPFWAIDTLNNRVALGLALYGKPSSTGPSSPFTFAGQTRMMHEDSSYLSVLEWDYAGTPLVSHHFVQPFFTDRSSIIDIAYGSNGDICLLGQLESDIRFGSITVSKAAGDWASYMARLRHNGTVAAAKKIYSSTTHSRPMGLAYNPVNKHMYFSNEWSKKLIINGNLVHNGAVNGSNLLLGETDSNLNLLRFASVRNADTNANLATRLHCYGLQVTPSGSILMAGSLRDSVRVGKQVFRNLPTGNQYNGVIFRFDKDLKFDTCYLSEGDGEEHIERFVGGPGNEIYAGGRFTQTVAFPPQSTFVMSSVGDAFVVALTMAPATTTTGIRGPQNGTTPWLVYPNPATDYVHLNLEKGAGASIYAADGRTVYRTKLIGAAAQRVDVRSFPPGVYFIRATAQDGRDHTASFIKK